MPLQHNPALLLSAFLRLARKKTTAPTPIEWVESIQAAALTGSSATVSDIIEKMQDQFAGTVQTEGGNTEWLRELPCTIIAELCEAALQRLEAEAAATDDDLTAPSPGSVRYADFSGQPCILG